MKKLHLLAIALVALGCGFILSWLVYDSRPVTLEAGQWFGNQVMVLPEFQLIDHNSQRLGHDQLSNKWSLMFFGYTNCPDICPTSLQTLAEMMKAIDDLDVRNAIQIIFVSVDPERDSAEVLKSYVQYFNKDFIGATAPLVDLEPLTRALGIGHSREKPIEGQTFYEVSHSSSIILIDPAEKFAGVFGAPHNASMMARDLVKIVERN
jgi:protein SCO1/2